MFNQPRETDGKPQTVDQAVHDDVTSWSVVCPRMQRGRRQYACAGENEKCRMGPWVSGIEKKNKKKKKTTTTETLT